MTLLELDKKYNFHDSCITHIDYVESDGRLEMLMDFCYWDQAWYVEGDQELMELKLVFNGIERYDGPCGDIDYFSIMNAEIKDDKFYMLIADDINDEYYELELEPSDVNVDIIRKFDDEE